MNNLNYANIQEELSKADMNELPVYKIAVLRNIMVEPIEPYIRYLLYKIGFSAKIIYSGYDQIVQEALSQQGVLGDKPDLILVFTYLETMSHCLACGFQALSEKAINEEQARIQDEISATMQGLRSQTEAPVLWHSFETPVNRAFGVMDTQKDNGQSAVIKSLNEFTRSLFSDDNNAFLVDMDLLKERVGAKAFYDPRYWHLSKAPYSREALEAIASEQGKFIRNFVGKTKKCLVLDCDNTLWGGIVGEDGIPSLKLGKSYPGSAYWEFQQEIVNLYHQGVILAICSKNNEEDVWRVFNEHPDMLLKEEQIAAFRIDWSDKATNVRELSGELNIGLDSMVFVDDSPFEISLVESELPQVETILLPQGKSAEYRNLLASCGLFDSLTLSSEDKSRGAMYRAETLRKKSKAKTPNLKEYYLTLEMEVVIEPANDFTIPRIAQLTQKTNQFNLTTRRYTELEIRTFAQSEEHDLICLKLSDRFGDSGITGVCLIRYDSLEAEFDLFLLSCRVLGRGVEEALLAGALELIRARGQAVAKGVYIPTQKNKQTEPFYETHGATRDSSENTVFVFDLEKTTKKAPDYFKKIQFDYLRDTLNERQGIQDCKPGV